MKARIWYHCSGTDHGERMVAARRPPILRTEKEPLTPRVCVAPTIAACFAAVLFRTHRPVYVYRTESPRRAVMPVGVWDQFLTRERWLVPPVTLVRDRIIQPDQVAACQSLIGEFHKYTGTNSDIVLRFAQFAIAVDVLGGTDFEKRFVHGLMKKWEWDDPRNVIIGRYLKWCSKE